MYFQIYRLKFSLPRKERTSLMIVFGITGKMRKDRFDGHIWNGCGGMKNRLFR